MKIKKSILLVAVLLMASLPFYPAYGQDAHFGTDIDYGIHPTEFQRNGMTGWQFLKIMTDARTAALGGLTTAMSHGDAASVFSNPASTADVKNWGISMTQMSYVADISYNSASVVKNMGKWGNIGLNLIYLDYGEMERTSVTSEVNADGFATGVINIDYNAGTFSGGDLAIGLSYARQITDKLQVGANLRYITETLDDQNSISTGNVALDIGTVYYTGIKSLRLAMVGRNFGPDARFTEFEEQVQIPPMDVRMPMVFALGAAFDVFEGGSSPHFLTVAGEFVHPNDGPERLNVGAEYTFNNLLTLRGGYRYNYDELGFAVGGGINYNTGSFGIKVNYALTNAGRLDYLHMFTIGLALD
jgi:hypothetical protein